MSFTPFLLFECISYFLAAVIKHHEQKRLRGERPHFTVGFHRGFSPSQWGSHSSRGMGLVCQAGSTEIAFCLHTGRRERRAYKTSESFPTDTFFFSVKAPPRIESATFSDCTTTRDQVFNYVSPWGTFLIQTLHRVIMLMMLPILVWDGLLRSNS